ncbi:hypothetical protein G6N76_07840 [Rhizobium daejeonense]|uniref:Uncharacterized protein n=1 Tax=Rhizobium daejeonense TaxID=240521 RepID=A0A6M1RXV4_9HYPH|nr:hypothetical protein [Rhizobium daejeonense]NGO63583.1 hypothetical protein [Rhizobium daejeonense]
MLFAALFAVASATPWPDIDTRRTQSVDALSTSSKPALAGKRDPARIVLTADQRQGSKARTSDNPDASGAVHGIELPVSVWALQTIERGRNPDHLAPPSAFNPRAPPFKAA